MISTQRLYSSPGTDTIQSYMKAKHPGIAGAVFRLQHADYCEGVHITDNLYLGMTGFRVSKGEGENALLRRCENLHAYDWETVQNKVAEISAKIAAGDPVEVSHFYNPARAYFPWAGML